MTAATDRAKIPGATEVAARLLVFFLLCFGVIFARALLIPIVVSLLISFLLAPFVGRMERAGLPRYPVAVITVLSSLMGVIVIGWFVATETSSLLNETPRFKENLSKRYSGLVELVDGSLKSVESILNVPGQPTKPSPKSYMSESAIGALPKISATRPNPTAVLSLGGENLVSPITVLSYVGLAAAEVIIVTIVIAVLSIFLLVYREDVRDRMMGLVGESRLILTTQIMQDVIGGVRRYLLLNLVVNLCFGCLLGFVLYLFDVPEPILWASIAVVFRFVPHIGVSLALIPPTILLLSADASWAQIIALLGTGALIDIAVSNIIEPLIYGRGIGVSAIAVILSALFWTWCWGPIGLILATPFTVCLAIFGRYIPGYEALSILFGEETGLSPAYRLYHRLIIGDKTSAERLIESYSQEYTPQNLLDELIIPALLIGEADKQRRLLSHENHARFLDKMKALSAHFKQANESPIPQQQITIVPVRLESERVIGGLLESYLASCQYQAQMLPDIALSSNTAGSVDADLDDKVVIIPFSKASGPAVRYLLRKLYRTNQTFVVIVFSPENEGGELKYLRAALPNNSLLLVSSVKELVNVITSLPPTDVTKAAA